MSDTNHEHGGCCPADPVVRDRNFASAIINKARDFLNPEGRQVAEALLAAARALLVARGDITGEPGVWLLAAEAHLPVLDGNHRDALWSFEEALRVAEVSLGETHFATGVCLANVAETNLNLGYADDAVDFYKRASTIIEQALEEQSEDHMRQYLASVRVEIVSGFKKAEKLLEKPDE